MDAWVEACQALPKDEVPGSSQIVQSAMRLAKLESDQGLSYEEVIAKYNSSVAGLKESDHKLQSSRTELTQLAESRANLSQECADLEGERKRLEAETGELTGRTKELSDHCRELEKTLANRQLSVSSLEEKDKSLKDKLPHLQEKAAVLANEIAERNGVLKDLESLGFPKTLLDQLNARLAEMAARYGRDGLTERFFQNLGNYDSCLGLETTRDSLAREVDALTRQRDSLIQLAEKLNLTPDEIGEGIAALKASQKKGVTPGAIISYRSILTRCHTDPQSFQNLVTEFGSLEQLLTARHGELEPIVKEIEVKRQILEQLKVQEAGTKDYLAFLKDSTVKEMKEAAGSVKGEVGKLCQEMQQDIATWGNVRSELGRCQNELKMARYFGTIPLSEEARLNLVKDMDAAIVVQYLILARAWCQMKLNPKHRPPQVIIKKYVGIAEYAQIELADVITWALLEVTEGSRQ